MKLYFDMDGTFVDLYGVDNWLYMLQSYNKTPYETAKPLCDMRIFARLLNKLHKKGVELYIISWLSKGATEEYEKDVTKAKKQWLRKHLKSVQWNDIYIIPYGEDKTLYTDDYGILFDDEEKNRELWQAEKGDAFDEKNMINILKTLDKFNKI